MDLLTTGFESEDIVYRFEITNVSPAAGGSKLIICMQFTRRELEMFAFMSIITRNI